LSGKYGREYRNIFLRKKVGKLGSSLSSVTIGDNVWIGCNCIILPGFTIGSGSIIGAGACVVNDVAESSIVGGVPAKLIKFRK